MDKLLHIVVFKSVWVWALIFFGFAAFQHAGKKKEGEILSLQQKLAGLQQEKEFGVEDQEELKLCLCSKSDPAWIELVLMKNLGVVPEGQIKVHFTSEE